MRWPPSSQLRRRCLRTAHFCAYVLRITGSYASHATLSGIVIDAEAAIVEIWAEPFEASKAVADNSSQRRFARDLRELGVKPNF